MRRSLAKRASMDTKEKRISGPTDYLANERTFLAWVQTGIALMGFGFVIVKFNFYERYDFGKFMFLNGGYVSTPRSLPYSIPYIDCVSQEFIALY